MTANRHPGGESKSALAAGLHDGAGRSTVTGRAVIVARVDVFCFRGRALPRWGALAFCEGVRDEHEGLHSNWGSAPVARVLPQHFGSAVIPNRVPKPQGRAKEDVSILLLHLESSNAVRISPSTISAFGSLAPAPAMPWCGIRSGRDVLPSPDPTIRPECALTKNSPCAASQRGSRCS